VQSFEKHALYFLLTHLFYGSVVGFIIGWMIIRFDFRGIGSMIDKSPDGWLWMILMFFGLFVTFGSIGMGVGIMSLGEERDE